MNNLAEMINEKLDEFLLIKYPENIFRAMKYTVMLPGKRLRPILCLEACRMFGGDYDDAIATACAIEMLHSQTLIHDDLPCMDNDDFRRGKPTNHRVFGEANAVLAGDALLTFAPQIILKNSNLSSDKIIRIMAEYFQAAGAFGVISGQVVDIECETNYPKNPKETLEFIHKHKTGDLFSLALRTGAIIADVDVEMLDLITIFAQKLGLAFQIADDILDEVSTFEKMGKTLGKDKASNKLTYVSLYGIDCACEKLNLLIEECLNILNDNNLKSNIFEEILSKIEKSIVVQ
ncbi:MAG: farnesyl diphosphate synthase [Candidatus Gastranaerophilales bacterium]